MQIYSSFIGQRIRAVTQKTRIIALVLALLAGALTPSFAQGTAFTYQGRLNNAGAPANGTYDMEFTLYSDPINNTSVGSPVTTIAVPVTNGLFTVLIDTNDEFGANAFNGAPRWLQIGVRTNNNALGTFTNLSPRQPVSPSPYAIYSGAAGTASSAAVADSVIPGSVTSTSIANGAVTSAQLANGAASANLAANSETAVPSGGIIMAQTGSATQNLLNAGYVKIGQVTLNPESWNTNLASGPADTGELVVGRTGFTSVWTGSEMIIWGGQNEADVPDGWGFVVLGSIYNIGAAYNPTANTWTTINTNSGLAPRIGHVAVWTGTNMIIWGGSDLEENAFTDGAIYNPATDSWSPMSKTGAPTARFSAQAVWTGSKMIVWGGGSGASGTDQPTGAVYNPAANTWTPVSTSGAPTNSLFMYMVWSGSQMIVFSSGNNSLVASGGRYNPVNNTWSAMNLTGAPPPVEDATAIWTGSNMIVWGGFNYNTYNTLNTGASYNPTANTWTTISSVGAPLPREQHGAVWTGSKMIIWGGQDGDSDDYGDGGIYDPVANSWTPTPTNGAPIARDSHTMVWTGSDVIVWGGEQYEFGFDNYYIYPEPGGLLYDYALWFPMTDAPGTGEPGARENATAVWTGSEMLIWGGDNSGFSLRTGGNFNPTANFWTGIPTNNAPTGRTGHTAIWTGSNMVVWGGTDNSGTSATGGRYDPVMNMWSPVSTANAPAARTAHVAVWTGTQMLIWGGAEGGLINPFPPVGGRYNPFNDTWTPMNATSEPTPTASAAAAWTGTEMVVWGGVQTSFSGTTYFATGGRYNPASDSWILMSTNNAPSARSRHSAVWSGTQYIVFGGTNGVTNLNTGGLYTVTNDSWTPLSTNNAPPPSSGISTVWAGNEMITYGGYMGTNFGYSYFGDIYDPTANTWTPTLDFPSFGVANHCALWIDSGMLIWGGYAGPEVGYSDQTALYTPQRTMNLLLRP